jgi:RNA polymerase sigma-70 factor (ECF subfamily)
MAIAGFRVHDALRKVYAGSRRQMVDIDEYAEIIADVTEPQGANEPIHEMLESVPEREKKILTLMHVEGFTAKEVGAQIGMKESAVKVAAHRAIKKLREKMGV